MAFFARPNLDDTQFKQLSGSTLTLSGTTQIAEQGGLQLPDGSGSYIPIYTCNPQPEDVLKYVSGCLILGTVSTGGTSTGIYNGLTPSSVCVGGMPTGTTLTGKTITELLQCILVPTLNPTLTAPSSTFTISPSTSLYEVGTAVNINASLSFNRGSISPAYCGGPALRSGLPIAWSFSQFGNPYVTGASCTCSFTQYNIRYGNNSSSGCVHYEAGQQPLNSSGSSFSTPLPAGSTNSTCPSTIISRNIVGIFPYYYGKVCSGGASSGSNRPNDSCILTIINSGSVGAGCTCNKVTNYSNSTISVNFNTTSDDYLWFATPVNGSTTKTCWYVDALNKGTIGGGVSAGCNLFPNFTTINVSSTIWGNVSCSPQTYRLYVSNYQTCSTSVTELRDS